MKPFLHPRPDWPVQLPGELDHGDAMIGSAEIAVRQVSLDEKALEAPNLARARHVALRLLVLAAEVVAGDIERPKALDMEFAIRSRVLHI